MGQDKGNKERNICMRTKIKKNKESEDKCCNEDNNEGYNGERTRTKIHRECEQGKC